MSGNGDLAGLWGLEPGLAFLNHGSFGACPTAVLAHQQRLRDELERQPVEFLGRRLPAALDAAREEVAAFLGAAADDLAFVTNSTSGVNTVLRSLSFSPGDELLTTDHAYNACANALDFVSARAGARVRVARVPFPLRSADQVVEAVLAAVTPKTRLALLDHVTSSTGLVFPLERLARELSSRGVEVLVDAAHAPGMVEVDLGRLEEHGVTYYTANGHKWLCAPKSVAVLWVRRDRQPAVRPLSISHGANTPRPGRSRFHDEADWTGTHDPTAYLAFPVAISHLASQVPGGWPEIRRRNHRLALEARDLLCAALGIAPPCPDDLVGSLAALPIPDGESAEPSSDPFGDPLQAELLRRGIEVPVFPWPAPPRRLLRISAQLYNRRQDYERLAAALGEVL